MNAIVRDHQKAHIFGQLPETGTPAARLKITRYGILP